MLLAGCCWLLFGLIDKLDLFPLSGIDFGPKRATIGQYGRPGVDHVDR
jgi:hypothetical protein